MHEKDRSVANSINVIYPYCHMGMWVFDDDRTGLVREAFVAGADTIIDNVLDSKGIQDAEKGFRLIFSAGEFPEYDIRLDWLRESNGGNWYRLDAHMLEGWLCPALLKYFDKAPEHIYARFEKGLRRDQ